VVALTLAAAVAGCTAAEQEESPLPSTPAPATAVATPTPTADGSATSEYRNSRWSDAIASVPYEMPEGNEFPAQAPQTGFAMSTSWGEDVAYSWWGCVILLSAWDAVDADDGEHADALLSQLNAAKVERPEQFSGWEAPAPVPWDDPVRRDAGESGLCAAWFAREGAAVG